MVNISQLKRRVSCFFKWFHVLIDSAVISGMTEQSKRNSTRPKKPPRYLQQEEIEYGIYGGPLPTDTKETRTNTLEAAQIAKILVKLLQTSNQKLRDYQLKERTDESQPKHAGSADIQNHKDNLHRNSDRKNGLSTLDPSTQPNKKGKDANERAANETYKVNSKNLENKWAAGVKAAANVAKGIASDLSYHNMLNQHIRSNFGDPNGLPVDVLMQLGLPKQLREPQGSAKKQSEKAEKQKKKRQFTVQSVKGSRKQTKEELKPFKRQSYHVAIAYYIHLKQVQASDSNSKNIDPTSSARKLREQERHGA